LTSKGKRAKQKKKKAFWTVRLLFGRNPWIHELTKKQKNSLWSPVLVGGTSVPSEIEGSGWLVYCYSGTTPYI
jgi:hypothetical protein